VVKYLEKNLVTPERFKQLSGAGSRASVKVEFTIGADGLLQEIYILHSVEWSVDAETIRVIKAAPTREPAIQSGRPVIYDHRRSMSYVVSFY
jgi:protein TonB